MHRGYIKIWRKIQDNFLYKEPRKFSKFEAWIDILMEVQYNPEPQKILLGNKTIICNRGESLKSMVTWANRWNWSRSMTRRFLVFLDKEGNIELKDERKTTRLKVINYDTYCPLRISSESHLNLTRISLESHLNTDNKVNKVNKEKKTTIEFPEWLDLEIWKEFKKYRQNGKAKFTFHAQKLAINKLTKLRDEGNNPNEVLNQSMLNGWSGLFPLKKSNKNKEETREEWIARQAARLS